MTNPPVLTRRFRWFRPKWLAAGDPSRSWFSLEEWTDKNLADAQYIHIDIRHK